MDCPPTQLPHLFWAAGLHERHINCCCRHLTLNCLPRLKAMSLGPPGLVSSGCRVTPKATSIIIVHTWSPKSGYDNLFMAQIPTRGLLDGFGTKYSCLVRSLLPASTGAETSKRLAPYDSRKASPYPSSIPLNQICRRHHQEEKRKIHTGPSM